MPASSQSIGPAVSTALNFKPAGDKEEVYRKCWKVLKADTGMEEGDILLEVGYANPRDPKELCRLYFNCRTREIIWESGDDTKPPSDDLLEPCAEIPHRIACRKSRRLHFGLENTGKSFKYFYTGNLLLSNGASAPLTLPASTNWSPQLVDWDAAVDAVLEDVPNATNCVVDPRCRRPAPQDPKQGCGGLLGEPEDVDMGSSMFYRYLHTSCCYGEVIPVGFELTATDHPAGVEKLGPFITVMKEGQETRYKVCQWCDERPDLWLKLNTETNEYEPVPTEEIPPEGCWLDCTEEWPAAPQPACVFTLREGCDGGTDPKTPMVRIYKDDLNGNITWSDYVPNPDDPQALDIYEDYVGPFVNCLTGDVIPPPEPECPEVVKCELGTRVYESGNWSMWIGAPGPDPTVTHGIVIDGVACEVTIPNTGDKPSMMAALADGFAAKGVAVEVLDLNPDGGSQINIRVTLDCSAGQSTVSEFTIEGVASDQQSGSGSLVADNCETIKGAPTLDLKTHALLGQSNELLAELVKKFCEDGCTYMVLCAAGEDGDPGDPWLVKICDDESIEPVLNLATGGERCFNLSFTTNTLGQAHEVLDLSGASLGTFGTGTAWIDWLLAQGFTEGAPIGSNRVFEKCVLESDLFFLRSPNYPAPSVPSIADFETVGPQAFLSADNVRGRVVSVAEASETPSKFVPCAAGGPIFAIEDREVCSSLLGTLTELLVTSDGLEFSTVLLDVDGNVVGDPVGSVTLGACAVKKWAADPACVYAATALSAQPTYTELTGGAGDTVISKEKRGSTADGLVTACIRHQVAVGDVPFAGNQNIVAGFRTPVTNEVYNRHRVQLSSACAKIAKTRIYFYDVDGTATAPNEFVDAVTPAPSAVVVSAGALNAAAQAQGAYRPDVFNTAFYLEFDGAPEVQFDVHKNPGVSSFPFSVEAVYQPKLEVFFNQENPKEKRYCLNGEDYAGEVEASCGCGCACGGGDGCPEPIPHPDPATQSSPRLAGDSGWLVRPTAARLTTAPGVVQKINANADNGWDNDAADTVAYEGDFRLEIEPDYDARLPTMVGISTRPYLPTTFSDQNNIWQIYRYNDAGGNARWRTWTRGYRPTLAAQLVDNLVPVPADRYVIQRKGTVVEWIRLVGGVDIIERSIDTGVCAPVYAVANFYKSGFWSGDGEARMEFK